ncbi:MAG: hypothetical protein E6R09_11755, partial [Rhodocyclaceae bacterium]
VTDSQTERKNIPLFLFAVSNLAVLIIVFQEIPMFFSDNCDPKTYYTLTSLLGITLAKPSSFPVGKVNFLQVNPMTFTEFLLANNDDSLVEFLKTIDSLEPIPQAFFNKLYEKLKSQGIYARRYFYPLISDFPMYRGLPSAERRNLPVAVAAAEKVLCLPIYPNLSADDQARVIGAIAH